MILADDDQFAEIRARIAVYGRGWPTDNCFVAVRTLLLDKCIAYLVKPVTGWPENFETVSGLYDYRYAGAVLGDHSVQIRPLGVVDIDGKCVLAVDKASYLTLTLDWCFRT